MTILTQTRRPDITFCKSGRIDITSRTAKMLKLADGDVIDIAHEGGEFLLFVRCKAADANGRHEAQLRATKPGKRCCNNLRAYSSTLCNAILEATGCDGQVRLYVGYPVEVPQLGMSLPIITRRPIIRSNDKGNQV